MDGPQDKGTLYGGSEFLTFSIYLFILVFQVENKLRYGVLLLDSCIIKYIKKKKEFNA